MNAELLPSVPIGAIRVSSDCRFENAGPARLEGCEMPE
jgi:hypothetical protein